MVAGSGFQAGPDDGGVEFREDRHHGDASIVGRVGPGASLMKRGDGELVPGRGSSSGGDCGEEVGQSAVDSSMFVVLKKFCIKPGVTQSFIVSQKLDSIVYFLWCDGGVLAGFPASDELFMLVSRVKLGQELGVVGVEVSRGSRGGLGAGLQQFPKGSRAVDAHVLQARKVGGARFAQGVTKVAAGSDGLG